VNLNLIHVDEALHKPTQPEFIEVPRATAAPNNLIHRFGIVSVHRLPAPSREDSGNQCGRRGIAQQPRQRSLAMNAIMGTIISEAGILFNEHIAADSPVVFAHACRLGAEGIVSKKVDSMYRSGRCRVWTRSVIQPASPCSGSAARFGIDKPRKEPAAAEFPSSGIDV
jgi:hypothetical protein